MTDPVAEAAAQIAAQQAEPSMLEKAMDTIHELEAKVEHLIHPEDEAPNVLPASTSGTLPESTPSATTGSIASSENSELGNVAAAATASSLPESSTPSAPPLPLTSTIATELSSSGMSADIPASTPEIGAVESPNAAPAVVEQPVIAASAPVASTVGIPGIIASAVAEPVKLTSEASTAIKAVVANIKHHLSIRGFEQSAVADIHAELAAIEKWL